MGTAVSTNVFPQLSQPLTTPAQSEFRVFGPQPGEGAALPNLLTSAAQGKDSAAVLGFNGGAADTFDAATYGARVQRVSLAAEFQRVRERIAAVQEGGGNTVAAAGVEQLEFRFVAESRQEELAIFQRRTAEVAAGLKGRQSESFVQASRQMAARFSLSVKLSGAALNGFAGAAEGLKNGGPDSLDQFIGFAQDALKQLDEKVSELFSLLHDLVQSGGELRERIDSFIAELRSLGLLGGGEAAAGPGNTLSAAAQTRSFSIQLTFEFEYQEVLQVQQGAVQQSDPIVFDLDGDGIELTSYTQGARFDITGTGKKVTTGFVTGGDAFLAIDRNGNGRIDDGTELFGDQNGAANGFEELRRLDTNGDGRINQLDANFNKLLLWRDNGNGITEPGELISLADAGIVEISLGYRNVNQSAAGGNRITQVATFVRADGSRGTAADALLNYLA
ncbi:MAG TPA: hypothetical protein PLD73_03855 [Candidatus Hydrogenedentes bacterium]|nr:hypothetical protein [Candidatus Hydrogenedentota bacterium]HPJ98471.1 hypothetical protein [Candidatus Hydrogenedentota bacterium]